MASKDGVEYGSDVSGGAFSCVDCGYGIQMESGDSLPPCPKLDDDHTEKGWVPPGNTDVAETPPAGSKSAR